MKNILIFRITIPLLLFTFLSSFSIENVRRDVPPVENVVQTKKEKKHNKRIQKLRSKLKKSKRLKRRQKIEKRLAYQKQQLDECKSPLLGILGLVSSKIAFWGFLHILGPIILAIGNANYVLFANPLFVIVGVFLLSIGAIIISIIGLRLAHKYPEKYGPKWLMILSLVLSIIVALLLLAALVLSFIFIL